MGNTNHSNSVLLRKFFCLTFLHKILHLLGPDMFKIFEHRMKEWDQQPFSFIVPDWGFHHQQWFLLFRRSGVGWESGILSLESPVSNWTFKSVETFWRFTKGSGSNPFYICCENGCFLKWWYLQNTPKWSFLVGKPMVVGYHHFMKPANGLEESNKKKDHHHFSKSSRFPKKLGSTKVTSEQCSHFVGLENKWNKKNIFQWSLLKRNG